MAYGFTTGMVVLMIVVLAGVVGVDRVVRGAVVDIAVYLLVFPRQELNPHRTDQVLVSKKL